jgi:epoxide hydrolase-like predicted phosphatase
LEARVIKAVIFDVGGVLLRTHDQTPRRRWERQLGLPPGGAEALVFNSPAGRQAQHGASTEAEHWAWIGRELVLSEERLARFRADFFAGDQMDWSLVDLIRRLHGPYQTAIISNAFDNLHRVLTVDFPIADAFDVIVGSAYEGIMKPDPEIYERTLARLGRLAPEAVFIDDAPANVAGARAVGMAAIHFTPSLDLPAALADISVRLGPAA